MIEWIKAVILQCSVIITLYQHSIIHTIPVAKRVLSRIKLISKQWKALKALRHSNERKKYKIIVVFFMLAVAFISTSFDIPSPKTPDITTYGQYEELVSSTTSFADRFFAFIDSISGTVSALLVSLSIASLIKYGLQLISWRWSIAGLTLTSIATIINFKYSIIIHLCETIGKIMPQNSSLYYYYATLPYVCTICMTYVSVMVILENCVDILFCLDALLNRITVKPVSETDDDVIVRADTTSTSDHEVSR